mmetsp:Transcript_50801/g.118421  ORF Transcript_50801/g.118421 Transcript_50801/m.118421 type:complete len:201 (-) Transcript_50801:280-882(-)
MFAVMQSSPKTSRELAFVRRTDSGTRASSSYCSISRRATNPRPDTSFSVCSRVSTAIDTPAEGCPQLATSDTHTPFSASHFSNFEFSSNFRRFVAPRPFSHRLFPLAFLVGKDSSIPGVAISSPVSERFPSSRPSASGNLAILGFDGSAPSRAGYLFFCGSSFSSTFSSGSGGGFMSSMLTSSSSMGTSTTPSRSSSLVA